MKCKNCGTEYEGNLCPNGCDSNVLPKKTKKPLYKKWWFWVIMGIATVVLLASIGGNSEPTVQTESPSTSTTETTIESETETKPEAETPKEDNVFNVGDVIEANGLKITYVSASEYISDNQFIQPKEGMMYVALNIKAENTADSDRLISSFDFECYADGAKMESNYLSEKGFEGGTLSSGRTSEGLICFEVPIDAKEIEVEYETNMWSDKKAILKVEL